MRTLRTTLNILFTFVFIAIMSNCSEKESALPALENETETIEELKTILDENASQNNLIKEVGTQTTNGIDFTRIDFETGNTLLFKTDLIESITETPEDWNVTLAFSDETSGTYAFVGDSLHITSIDLDPYSLAPLSAQVSLEMPVAGKIGIEVLGKGDNGITISNLFDQFDVDFELPILGLYNNFENQVRISFYSENDLLRHSEIHTIVTDNTEIELNTGILTNNLPAEAQNIYLISNLNLGFDQTGEVRWLFSGSTQIMFRKLANGNLLLAGRDGAVSYHPRKFYEVTMLGEIIKDYTVPNNLHHEIKELPNGNFLVASNSLPIVFGDDTNEEDLIIEIDRETGQVVKSWDFNDILDPERTKLPNTRIGDWLHINALYFDAEDESIVISGRNQSTVAKIDYNTNEVKWMISNPNGWAERFADKLLSPVDANGASVDPTTTDFWLAGQHAPLKLPNGNILIYDNGYFRNFYNDPQTPEKSYTRVAEYRVDESNMTVELVSSFTYKDINTTNTGDVDYLEDTEGFLVGFMNGRSNSTLADAPKILELDADKNVIFEVDVNVGMGIQYYRAERMFLYEGMD